MSEAPETSMRELSPDEMDAVAGSGWREVVLTVRLQAAALLTGTARVRATQAAMDWYKRAES